MLNRLLLASLVLLPLTAAADGAHPSPPTPPGPPPGPPKMCKADGRILFTSKDRSLAAASAHVKTPLKSFTLKDTGRWELSTFVDGKLTASSEGCVPDAQVKVIHDAIDHSEWKTTHNEVACDAMSAVVTDFEGTGHRKLFTNELCSANVLDATSAKNLSAILLIVSPLIDPPPGAALHDGKK